MSEAQAIVFDSWIRHYYSQGITPTFKERTEALIKALKEEKPTINKEKKK